MLNVAAGQLSGEIKEIVIIQGRGLGGRWRFESHHHIMVCDAMLLDDPGNEWSKKEKKRFEDWLQSTATCQNPEDEEDWEGKVGKRDSGVL